MSARCSPLGAVRLDRGVCCFRSACRALPSPKRRGRPAQRSRKNTGRPSNPKSGRWRIRRPRARQVRSSACCSCQTIGRIPVARRFFLDRVCRESVFSTTTNTPRTGGSFSSEARRTLRNWRGATGAGTNSSCSSGMTGRSSTRHCRTPWPPRKGRRRTERDWGKGHRHSDAFSEYARSRDRDCWRNLFPWRRRWRSPRRVRERASTSWRSAMRAVRGCRKTMRRRIGCCARPAMRATRTRSWWRGCATKNSCVPTVVILVSHKRGCFILIVVRILPTAEPGMTVISSRTPSPSPASWGNTKRPSGWAR